MSFDKGARLGAWAQSEGSISRMGETGPPAVRQSLVQVLLQAELRFEQAIAGHRDLALFRRNVATWELLLRVAREQDGIDRGLHGLVQEIRSRGLGTSALLQFLRDRRSDGQLIMCPDPDKRSRQRISLRPDLVETLGVHLLSKYRASEAMRSSAGVWDRGP